MYSWIYFTVFLIKTRLNDKTSQAIQVVNIIVKAIYNVFFNVYMVAYHHPCIGLVDKTSRVTRKSSVFSAVCLGPLTKLMWIPACNQINLQADTQWKGKVIRETTFLINGFKPKTTKSPSCWPDVWFNDRGKCPYVCLSNFALSTVLGKLLVNYWGLF